MCDHENTTECLAEFRANESSRDRRSYEVYCCLDCKQVVNFAKSGDAVMEPMELLQLFVDLRDHFYWEVGEILTQANDLMKKFRDLPERMPRK